MIAGTPMPKEFFAAICEAATLTQSEYSPGTPEVYWNEFGKWPVNVFREALVTACRHRNSFPPVALIRECRPQPPQDSSWKIGIDQKYTSMFPEASAEDIPEHLASLTDEQIQTLFDAHGLRNTEKHVKEFRRGQMFWVDELQVAYDRFNYLLGIRDLKD